MYLKSSRRCVCHRIGKMGLLQECLFASKAECKLQDSYKPATLSMYM
jgi:hypothetical protein